MTLVLGKKRNELSPGHRKQQDKHRSVKVREIPGTHLEELEQLLQSKRTCCWQKELIEGFPGVGVWLCRREELNCLQSIARSINNSAKIIDGNPGKDEHGRKNVSQGIDLQPLAFKRCSTNGSTHWHQDYDSHYSAITTQAGVHTLYCVLASSSDVDFRIAFGYNSTPDDPTGAKTYTLKAGQCIMFPSRLLHQVSQEGVDPSRTFVVFHFLANYIKC